MIATMTVALAKKNPLREMPEVRLFLYNFCAKSTPKMIETTIKVKRTVMEILLE